MIKSNFPVKHKHDNEIDDVSSKLCKPYPESHDDVQTVLQLPLSDDFRLKNSGEGRLTVVADDVHEREGVEDDFWQTKHENYNGVCCQSAAHINADSENMLSHAEVLSIEGPPACFDTVGFSASSAWGDGVRVLRVEEDFESADAAVESSVNRIRNGKLNGESH